MLSTMVASQTSIASVLATVAQLSLSKVSRDA
jgi:hypothetical protein